MKNLLKNNPKKRQFYSFHTSITITGEYYEVFIINKEKIFERSDILDKFSDPITIPFIMIWNDNGRFSLSFSTRDYSKSVILASWHPQKARINEIYSIINLLVKIKYTEN